MRKVVLLSSIYCLFTVFLFLVSSTAHAQSVDILWQGDGYVPPFYKGLSLWANQSSITLAAVPQGLGDPAGLNYRWTRNGTVLGNISGIGKNSLTFVDSVLSRPQTFKVEIVANNEEVLAESTVTVAPRSPILYVYENSPLYGFLFHKEVYNNYPIEESEVTFAAFPLFFSARSRADQALTYSWETNSGAAGGTNSVTYRVPENTEGSSFISAGASHKTMIMQTAEKRFLVKFGNENSN